jgi:hypothetical protein
MASSLRRLPTLAVGTGTFIVSTFHRSALYSTMALHPIAIGFTRTLSLLKWQDRTPALPVHYRNWLKQQDTLQIREFLCDLPQSSRPLLEIKKINYKGRQIRVETLTYQLYL